MGEEALGSGSGGYVHSLLNIYGAERGAAAQRGGDAHVILLRDTDSNRFSSDTKGVPAQDPRTQG